MKHLILVAIVLITSLVSAQDLKDCKGVGYVLEFVTKDKPVGLKNCFCYKSAWEGNKIYLNPQTDWIYDSSGKTIGYYSKQDHRLHLHAPTIHDITKSSWGVSMGSYYNPSLIYDNDDGSIVLLHLPCGTNPDISSFMGVVSLNKGDCKTTGINMGLDYAFLNARSEEKGLGGFFNTGLSFEILIARNEVDSSSWTTSGINFKRPYQYQLTSLIIPSLFLQGGVSYNFIDLGIGVKVGMPITISNETIGNPYVQEFPFPYLNAFFIVNLRL